MLGYTEDELTAYFGEHTVRHAAMMGLDMPAYLAEFRGVSENTFDVTDLAHLKAVPMLYQIGYLSNRDYTPVERRVCGCEEMEDRLAKMLPATRFRG